MLILIPAAMQRGGMHLTLAESKRGSLSRKSISAKLNIMPPDRTKEPMFHPVSVKRRKNFEERMILSNTAQGELSMGGFRKTFVNSLSTVGVQQRSQRITRVASLWCDRLLVFIPQIFSPSDLDGFYPLQNQTEALLSEGSFQLLAGLMVCNVLFG